MSEDVVVLDRPHVIVLRASLEAIGPLLIGNGEATPCQDVCLARDANGLPMIPGASLAGVLRNLYLRQGGKETNALFGCAGDRSEKTEEMASQISVSAGYVHGEKDIPVEGLCDPKDLLNDPILAFLALDAPVLRDHVAINGRGAAASGMKFDRALVPPGAHFSIQLIIRAENDAENEAENEATVAMRQIAAIMASPAFRLGGATRRGYGRVRVIPGRVDWASWDLRETKGRAAQEIFAASGIADRPEDCNFRPVEKAKTELDFVTITQSLSLRDGSFLRVGSGAPVTASDLANTDENAHDPDASPLTETWIDWIDCDNGQKGVVRDPLMGDDPIRFVIPGSGIKGALAHRTLFEWRRGAGVWNGNKMPDGWSQLFGEAANASSNEVTGRAGSVFIDDAHIDVKREDLADHLVRLDHVSIDRFTQGARDGALFSETALFNICLGVEIAIDHRDTSIPPALRQAFKRSLDALFSGRLAIGANDGDGMGRLGVGGETKWPSGDARDWFKGGPKTSAGDVS